jgi:two-component system phosphate regulon sensor histidine kinase PhoR
MAARLWLGAALITIIAAVALSAPLPVPLRIATVAVAVLCAILIAAYFAPAQLEAPSVGQPQLPQPPPDTLHLETVLDALPVAVMIVGADGKIAAFNAAAGEMFGVPAERAAGRSLIETARNFELDRRVTATLKDSIEETSVLTYSAAQERRLQITTRLLRGSGPQSSALIVATDITRMRELEALRREFVSNVSHELRTPLTAVKLMVETLQTGVERPASDEFLSSIAQETERMIALVEDLLDLARLESGKIELRLGCVDVAELCRQAALAQRPRSQAQGVELECSTPEEPIRISADRDKLYQVLVNLLDNALRHTPATGRVTISASSNDGSVSIAVADSGSGIPSTALPHIFERFYVVDPARARGRSGTGLGLAIVKHIIEAHGGTIAAESELGVGTVFRCVLPAGLQTSEPVL